MDFHVIVCRRLVVLSIAAAMTSCLDRGASQRLPGDERQGPGADSAPADAMTGDPASGDFDLPPPPILDGTNASRAIGFSLFYRERLIRHLIAFNRFAIAGDAVFAHSVANNRVAKSGNDYEVVVGPNDNNGIGKVTFEAAQAYRAFGGHELELTLIRLFEGLVFLEAVSGHPGLTSRMAVPGWTLTLDGVTDTVSRTRFGVPVDSPVVYSPALESIILDTFFAGTRFTYLLNPEEQYVLRYPVMRLSEYALTYVFSGLPVFLRISDCCASYIVTQEGEWRGAYWSNHNSRDNFPDLMMGYLAAMDLVRDPTLPADLWISAERARVAGERVGARIVADGNKLMTVSEYESYDDLIPGGQTRPDGRVEAGDLGSLNTCQLAYLAEAMAPTGLDVPVPTVPLGDSPDNLALRSLLTLVGLDITTGTTTECHSLDDALGGMTWGELRTRQVGGVSWLDLVVALSREYPDKYLAALADAAGNFQFLELSAVAIVYYAQVVGRPALQSAARETLGNLVTIHRALANAMTAAAGDPPDTGALVRAAENRYLAAVWAALFGLDTPIEDFDGFATAADDMARREFWVSPPDTTPAPLLSDAEIAASIQAELDKEAVDAPQVVSRYTTRFASGPPLRRAGDGYEAVDLNGQWVATPNGRHLGYGEHHLFFELPLCVTAPDTISCAWARLGCGRADLDLSGTVDASDQTLFDAARVSYAGATCRPENAWCAGADLDRNYVVNDDDAAFMAAAQGCTR